MKVAKKSLTEHKNQMGVRRPKTINRLSCTLSTRFTFAKNFKTMS